MGCGYIDAPSHAFVHPAFTPGAKSDHGGNYLDCRGNPHTSFDTNAVGAARRAVVARGGWLAYAKLLAARAPAPGWATSGAPANRPKQWT